MVNHSLGQVRPARPARPAAARLRRVGARAHSRSAAQFAELRDVGGVRRRLFGSGCGGAYAYAKQGRSCRQLSNSSWYIIRGQATPFDEPESVGDAVLHAGTQCPVGRGERGVRRRLASQRPAKAGIPKVMGLPQSTASAVVRSRSSVEEGQHACPRGHYKGSSISFKPKATYRKHTPPPLRSLAGRTDAAGKEVGPL